ncbi:MAG: lipoprotein signal peptidase [Gammaproteobacteria bacterium]|nr:lipoprotein signal peptidase [Gammaproteobacteria bacterium]
MPDSALRYLWISAVIIGLDQITKLIAESQLPLHQTVNVIPYFDWYLTYNSGAAFSFLADAGGWQRWFFTIASVVISVVILIWIKKLEKHDNLTAISLCMILGGAIGNLIDRIYLGHVIDYIQVWLGSYPWPAFNIADAAISVGAAVLIISSFVNPQKTAEADNGS